MLTTTHNSKMAVVYVYTWYRIIYILKGMQTVCPRWGIRTGKWHTRTMQMEWQRELLFRADNHHHNVDRNRFRYNQHVDHHRNHHFYHDDDDPVRPRPTF